MGSSLTFTDVGCIRGARVLFSRVSFALAAGEVLRITGPNGVGKSSLLRLAAGLLTAANGTITRVGRIALADEVPALDPAKPLGAALGFWAALDGGNVNEGVDEGLAAVGMAHLAAVPVRMLSTGQRRRASLARTIAARADIWLLDEPSNGLDSDGVAMLEGIVAVHRARGGIAVVATHVELALPGAKALTLG